MTKAKWEEIIRNAQCDTVDERIIFLLHTLQDFNWHQDIEDDVLTRCALNDLERAFNSVIERTGDLFTGV